MAKSKKSKAIKDKCTLLEKLLADGWFDDEKEALPWVLQRHILVDNRPAHSLKQIIPGGSAVSVKQYYLRKYANKGGLKLEKALADFGVDVRGKTALDCGASTGGFTDCLLQNGAEVVYAVDRGYGQLAAKLLNNPKLVNMEKTELSDGRLERLAPKPEIVTLDINDVSLRQSVLCAAKILRGGGVIIALAKPVYEVAPAGRGGEMDAGQIKDILGDLCGYFAENDLRVLGLTHSPIRGNGGTLEYFFCLDLGLRLGKGQGFDAAAVDIGGCVEQSFLLGRFNEAARNSYAP